MMWRFTVPGIPRSGKNSGKMIWRKKAGITTRFRVPSDAANAWLSSAREAYMKAPRPRRLITVPVAIDIQVFQPHRKPDGDNVQNLVWDSLKGIVLADDDLCDRWTGARHVGVEPARVEITVTLLGAA